MNRLVLLCCGALIAASLTTAGASAAKVKSCKTVGMAAYVQQIQKRGVSCADARIVIRSVEAHGAQCKPDKQDTVAVFRECAVVPVLSAGERSFTCRSTYETTGSNKRWWDTMCRSAAGDTVHYRRDGNAAGG